MSDHAKHEPAPSAGREVVLDAVISDLQERAEFGLKKYGTKLMTHNGRDALVDALQEAYDLSMYLKQALLERDNALVGNARDDLDTIMRTLSASGLNDLQWAGVDNAVRRIERDLADMAEVIQDYLRLTKELDVALNGDGAAAAPSLCDIVAQVRSLGPAYKSNAEWRNVADRLAKALGEHVVENCECSHCTSGNIALAEYKRMAQ